MRQQLRVALARQAGGALGSLLSRLLVLNLPLQEYDDDDLEFLKKKKEVPAVACRARLGAIAGAVQ